MQTYHNIKDLNISLDDLYNQKQQLRVHLTDNKYMFSVVLIGRDNEADCLISSFSANFYFRTQNGMNRKKYKTISNLQNAINKSINKNLDSIGVISFSLSDDINLF